MIDLNGLLRHENLFVMMRLPELSGVACSPLLFSPLLHFFRAAGSNLFFAAQYAFGIISVAASGTRPSYFCRGFNVRVGDALVERSAVNAGRSQSFPTSG